MTRSDSVWRSVTQYDEVWLTMTHFDSVWRRVTYFDSVWPCMTHYASVWLNMTHYGLTVTKGNSLWLTWSQHDSASLTMIKYDSVRHMTQCDMRVDFLRYTIFFSNCSLYICGWTFCDKANLNICTLPDHAVLGADSQSIQTNDLQNWYVSLPNLTLSVNRIGQRLVSSVSG